MNNDDRKPTQFRYTFVDGRRETAVVVQLMYTRYPGDRDVIGFMNLPAETAKVDGMEVTVLPPAEAMELFQYHNLVVWIRAFPLNPAVATQAIEFTTAGKAVGLELRRFLDQQFSPP